MAGCEAQVFKYHRPAYVCRFWLSLQSKWPPNSKTLVLSVQTLEDDNNLQNFGFAWSFITGFLFLLNNMIWHFEVKMHVMRTEFWMRTKMPRETSYFLLANNNQKLCNESRQQLFIRKRESVCVCKGAMMSWWKWTFPYYAVNKLSSFVNFHPSVWCKSRCHCSSVYFCPTLCFLVLIVGLIGFV